MRRPGRYALITGGSGFIGSNVARRLLEQGERVLLYDNLSRPGVVQNYEWLRAEFGPLVCLLEADVRDADRLRAAVQGASSVFHYAAQVAVTTSLVSPLEDFEINGRGTLNLLEALRALSKPPPLLFTSTNKVYGALSEVALRVRRDRYEAVDANVRKCGVNESARLDFYSPYGCSKGAAEQYVLDYARTFGLPAVVFRMSCIYGPRQFGTEDQGWVAHFLIRTLNGEPITLYGDGRQVRDILFVEDLVEAFLLARQKIAQLRGRVFNIGGGPANAVSLLELLDLIGQIEGATPVVEYSQWRPGDQRFYVSDTTSFQAAAGWRPRTGVKRGLCHLRDWLLERQPAVILETAVA